MMMIMMMVVVMVTILRFTQTFGMDQRAVWAEVQG
jgi:hypothetical protein